MNSINQNNIQVVSQPVEGNLEINSAVSRAHSPSGNFPLESNCKIENRRIELKPATQYPLHEAVINCDWQAMGNIMSTKCACCELKVLDDRGFTPLSLAVLNNQPKIVAFFLNLLGQHISALNIKTKSGNTALHYAAASGDLEMVKRLVQKGAELDSNALNGDTLLHYAVFSGNCELIDYFIEEGLDLYETNLDGENMLHFAASIGNKKVLFHLIEIYGMRLNEKDNSGQTALHKAMMGGTEENLNVMEILLMCGANRFIKDNEGKSAGDLISMFNTDDDKKMHQWRASMNSAFLGEVSDHPVTNFREAMEKTLKELDATNIRSKLIKYMGENNYEVIPKTIYLREAIRMNDITAVKVALNAIKNALPVEKLFKYQNPLNDVFKGKLSPEVVDYLINSACFPVNELDPSGESPVHLAIKLNKMDLLQKLVQSPRYIKNKEYKNGKSLLTYALVDCNNEKASKILFAAGEAMRLLSPDEIQLISSHRKLEQLKKDLSVLDDELNQQNKESINLKQKAKAGQHKMLKSILNEKRNNRNHK